jgi:hypothetical protein
LNSSFKRAFIVTGPEDEAHMRAIGLFSAALVLICGSAFAQPTSQTGRSTQAPVDHGPFTPEANRAYMGGGGILQGAPGAPPPTPEPTPPGQTPRNMVPPR